MNKCGKVIASVLLSGLMAFSFAACGPDSEQPNNPNNPNNPNQPSTSYVDETMGGANVVDHVFEAEAAIFSGISSTGAKDQSFGDHVCTPVSYVVDEGFSGGICVRNAGTPEGSETPNKFTFNFTSDKAVRVVMEIRISSRQGVKCYLSTSHTIFVNGEEMVNTVQIPAGSSKNYVLGSKEFDMQTVELEIKLNVGENTIVFEAAEGEYQACNLDYINIKTSANLTGFVPHYWDMSGATVTEVPKVYAGGTLVISDEHATNSFELPSLASSCYTKETKDGKEFYYLAGSDFVIAVVTGDEDVEMPVDETQNPDVVPNRFEAEASVFTGASYGNTFPSPRSSYAVGAGFSGGICLKNTPSNSEEQINTFTFTITSDKSVIANMNICVASLDQGQYTTVFSDHMTLMVNNNEVDTSELIVYPKGHESQVKAISDYFWMQVLTVPVTLVKGRNTITFIAAVGKNASYNFDYIEIATTASLSFTPNYLELGGIKVLTAPTMEATGKLRVADSATGKYYTDYTIPTLDSDIYTTQEKDGVTSWYLGGTGVLINDSESLKGDSSESDELSLVSANLPDVNSVTKLPFTQTNSGWTICDYKNYIPARKR